MHAAPFLCEVVFWFEQVIHIVQHPLASTRAFQHALQLDSLLITPCTPHTSMSHANTDGNEGIEQASQPVLCSKGCGFFGYAECACQFATRSYTRMDSGHRHRVVPHRNPASLNMCSKCYRAYCADQEREKGQAGATAEGPMPSTVQQLTNADVAEVLAAADAVSKAEQDAVASADAGILSPPTTTPTAAASGDTGKDDDTKPVQLNTNRCFECNKRVGLTGFKCRCGYVYCASHRYAEKHNCSFDYKTAGRQTLATNNPVVASAKVNKI